MSDYQVTVIADFKGQSASELDLTRGETVTVTSSESSGVWLYGTNSQGNSGWFDASCVQRLTASNGNAYNGQDQSSRASPGRLAADLLNQLNLNFSSGQTTPGKNFAAKQNLRAKFVVKVLYPYTSQTSQELSVFEGEQLDITEEQQEGEQWLSARNASGETGLVPITYVERIESRPSKTVQNSRPWYQSGISRSKAEEILSGASVETFLIRDSEAKPGNYTVSVKGPERVVHVSVKATGDGFKIGARLFNTFEEIVEFYSESCIYINGPIKLHLGKPARR